MKPIVLLASLLIASSAAAQGVSRVPPREEAVLWGAFRNAVLAGGTVCGGRVLPANRAFLVTAVDGAVQSAGGGGAGTSVFTLTDGTNTCTATFLCTATASTGAKRVAAVNGSGAGCYFPANAAITMSVTATTCTTTQPNFSQINVVGRWQ